MLYNTKWFVAAVSTVLPMMFVADFVSPRTGIFFQIFLAIFSVSFFIYLIDLLILCSDNNNISKTNKWLMYDTVWFVRKILTNMVGKSNSNVINIAMHVIMIVNIYYLFYECNKAYMVKIEMDNRVDYLSKYDGKNKDLVVKNIRSSVPDSKKYNDIGIDIKDWKNMAVAQYFGLSSIRTTN